MKRIITKIIALSAVFFMLAGLNPPVAKMETQGNLTVFSALKDGNEDYSLAAQSIVSVKGELMIINSQGIYVWTPGQKEASLRYRYPDEMVRNGESMNLLLLTDGEELYLFNRTDATLHKAVINADTLSVGEQINVDLSIFRKGDVGTADFYVLIPQQMMIENGKLWTVFVDYSEPEPSQKFYGVDLKTGEIKQSAVKDVRAICAYQGGKLLVQILKQEEYWNQNGSTNAPKLAVYDPETDTVSELGLLGQGISEDGMLGQVYDRNQELAYYITRKGVYSRDAKGNETLCAYAPIGYAINNSASSFVRVNSDYLAYLNYTEVTVMPSNPALLPTESLTVNHYDLQLLQKAAALMPGVAIQTQNNLNLPDAQSQDLALSGEDTGIDVYSISRTQTDVLNLAKKGYCQDLSSSEKLKAYVEKLYPFMSETCYVDGKLVMIPVNSYPVYSNLYFSFDDKKMKEFGLPLPSDYLELLKLYKQWQEGLKDKHPEYRLIEEMVSSAALIQSGVQSYISQSVTNKETLKFDTPFFRELMNACKAITPANEQLKSDEETSEFDNRPCLINMPGLELVGMDMGLKSDEAPVLKLLPLKAGMKPSLTVDISYLAVNPKSKNVALSIALIENMVANLEPQKLAAMMPERNEPIETRSFSELEKGFDLYYASVQEKLEKSEGAEKTHYEEELKNLDEQKKQGFEPYRYLVSAESLKLYRDLMTNSGALDFQMLGVINKTEIFSLIDRFAQDEISVDQFAKELDGQWSQIRLENQK